MAGKLIRYPVVQRSDYLVSLVTGAGRVLHVGCADWPFSENKIKAGSLLHQRLSGVADVTGVDLSQEGLRHLREAGMDNVVLADATDLPEGLGKFDMVVLSDVLEHVDNAGALLRGAVRALNTSPAARVVVSVPNAFSAEIVMKVAANRESVHPDHVAYYSFTTLGELLRQNGLAMFHEQNRYQFEQRPGTPGSFGNRATYLAARAVCRAVPHYASGIIAVAKPAVVSGPAIRP